VRSRRVYYLIDDRLVIPGPRVAEGTKVLADVLHPGAVK
jgi:ABC-type Fe3+-hydroxamate transport system substrate-binding protein